ncbi:MAG: glutamate-5-semialdehyde dehydrogenase, partial [Spirochaetia bacterium]|nr:glutamate-5-semialdehyde dehydrogenase [Spirochaetia bacterium]
DLRASKEIIKRENAKDISAADGLSTAMIDRLFLDDKRIDGMAASLEEIAAFEDYIGRVENMRVRPSGIKVGQMRIPIGVVAAIFESRPNVTIDIAALSMKSGNACILRGGKEAINSNIALHGIVKSALASHGLPENIVTLVERTGRELVPILLKQNKYIDVVIPRGGEGLIRMVTEQSTIPLLKHDKGLCHIYVDASADEDMSNRIAVNAKVQRPSACNSAETLLIHKNYPHKESLLNALLEHGVELRGCAETVSIFPGKILTAGDADWDTEYLDNILSVKIVDDINQAMSHIAVHGSGHSDAIITEDYRNSELFLRDVDSAAVFVNASTRFHDGGEFGLGAEVGISTERLHARGAMGAEGLTTLKYIVYGQGEVR